MFREYPLCPKQVTTDYSVLKNKIIPILDKGKRRLREVQGYA